MIKAKKRTKQKKTFQFNGWATTDEDEIIRRQLRASQEKMRVTNLEPEHDYFSTFQAESLSGGHYLVEIRSLEARDNSCDCPDFKTNQLGSCKHIEYILLQLKKRGVRKFKQAALAGSQRIEIYLDKRDDNCVKVLFPQKINITSKAYGLIEPYFSSNGNLLSKPAIAFPALERLISQAHKSIRNKIRLSKHIKAHVQQVMLTNNKQQARENFLKDVERGKQSMQPVNHPLFTYQQQGMLHLAFNERALLADEMGLGKTVQAIAAAQLLYKLRGIKRVLIVATASLKTEWEEQIKKFSGLSIQLVFGSRKERLQQYRADAFYFICNYEQVLRDVELINRGLMPDVVILDEAQRIKNWQTKTAAAIKRLQSRYAFVLTGTPVENRIDDIYSIVQFLRPNLFGALFRFNREFYQLNDKGKPVGYKNLDELHRRIKPILLRRTKEDVEEELPERSVNNYFVTMSREQNNLYAEHSQRLTRYLNILKKRPLTKEENQRMHGCLACMRMVCDSPYILDLETRISPKLDEFVNLLDELMADPSNKIIIFSEWERMLQLVREKLQQLSFGAAWHTGSVAQTKRREEIKRFKSDPNCRFFLSTDSGSLGLNLQVANVVINFDLPWNPAKLEQRIARAWRKYQSRHVQVINLVTEDSIESRMLGLLEQKRQLSKGILEGIGETKMQLPSGRTAFIDRIQQLIDDDQVPITISSQKDKKSLQASCDDLLAKYQNKIDYLALSTSEGKIAGLLVAEDEQTAKNIQSLKHGNPLEVIDYETYQLLLRLESKGLLSLSDNVNVLHQSANKQTKPQLINPHWIEQAIKLYEQAERKWKIGQVLLSNEFIEESLAAFLESVKKSLHAYGYLKGFGETFSEKNHLALLTARHQLPEQYASLHKALHMNNGKQKVHDYHDKCQQLLGFVKESIKNSSC